ncbi:MAG: biopolymer transporter ExbD [Candidatus Neomarinimicrobiota bacterium]|jgi:biopolymer transport protein ExbD|nr:biopolymer transporter ExbD [Candidatus Neomarinimicrobiota bacterium]MEC8706628.1 biopolymer transporter ExbD [Candidatus Neomarinimicrobiota bacterium]|tara:strand:- start:1495 stop:1893 length:399 start_codon:yes stop_codon:yes gene_type:complete
MAKQKRRFKGGEIPTSSMADIAFLLLIFFLVTTTIDMDKGLGMVLPAEGEEMEINKKNILNCLINSTGNVLLGGEAVDIKNLAKAVRQKIAQNDKLVISVKAHNASRYEDYVRVIDQLKQANATRISIAESD